MGGKGSGAKFGEANPQWQGDDANVLAGRKRAQHRYQLTDCVRCGRPGRDRHHKDGDTKKQRLR